MNNRSFAKTLRKQQTDSERKLWEYLRNKQLIGLKFRRQVPLGNYIADFVCFEKKIILELDGGQHNQTMNITRDKNRTRYFTDQGFIVLRFWNNQVLDNIEGVLTEIVSYITPHPDLLPQGEKEDRRVMGQ